MKLFFISIFIFITVASCTSVNKESKEQNLKGYYSYMADAAFFTDCNTKKQYPVAQEADNIELEKAYLKIRNNPGEKVVVTLTGHFELKNKTENKGKVKTLIVTKFNKIWPYVDCTRNLGTAKLKNTFWALRKINGISIKDFKFEKEPFFILKQNNRTKGFGGCNSFTSAYNVNGNTLIFSKIAATLKMCNSHTEIESNLFKTLKMNNKYKIYGEYLYLFQEEKIAAIFESVYFN